MTDEHAHRWEDRDTVRRDGLTYVISDCIVCGVMRKTQLPDSQSAGPPYVAYIDQYGITLPDCPPCIPRAIAGKPLRGVKPQLTFTNGKTSMVLPPMHEFVELLKQYGVHASMYHFNIVPMVKDYQQRLPEGVTHIGDIEIVIRGHVVEGEEAVQKVNAKGYLEAEGRKLYESFVRTAPSPVTEHNLLPSWDTLPHSAREGWHLVALENLIAERDKLQAQLTEELWRD